MLNCTEAPFAPCDLPVSEFQRELVSLIPFLRLSSRGMCRGRALADDMVQDALFRAWKAQSTFQPGTSMKAWLFTILRNCIHSQARRAWRDVESDETFTLAIPAPPLEQDWALQLSDVSRAISTLPKRQREALILVAAGGLTHKEASDVVGSADGTMKSRVARGRMAMRNVLESGRALPPRPMRRAADARSDILAELSAITSRSLAGAGVPAPR